MKVDLVRKIDYWIGVPVCLVLTGLHYLLRLISPTKDFFRSPRKFLFLELSEMGSAVLAYPAMRYIKRLYPQAELFFLIFEKNRASVDILGLIPEDKVLTISEKSFLSFLTDVVKVILRMRREKIDVVFDLELFARVTAILTFFSGAPLRVGFYRYGMEGLYRGNFHTHRMQYNFQQHMSKTFLSMVEVLKQPAKDVPTMDRSIPQGDIKTAAYAASEEGQINLWHKLKRFNPEIKEDRKLIVLNPSAGDIPIRAWPLENYIALADRLVPNPDHYLILMGAKADWEINEKVRRAVNHPRCLNFAGQTTFPELMDLFSIAQALITNDSGPAHFASMTPIRNFVFMGPEIPALYRPLSARTHVFYSNFPCSPCLTAYNHRNTPCRDNKCLQAISVDEVYEVLLNALQ
jgi:ADP-heptose:LPS heptosyltransferase